MENEIRSLTREEQLEYIIEFLEVQIKSNQYDLELYKTELESIQNQKLERKLKNGKRRNYFN